MKKVINIGLLLFSTFSVPLCLGGQERATPTQRRAAPVAPTNLTAFGVSTNQINLTWANNANDATGFFVDRALSAAGPWTRIATLSADTTSCASTGLRPATVYYYRVSAYNTWGNSFSEIVSAKPLSPLPAGAPINLMATSLGSTAIKLAWTNNASDATGFKIERCQSDGCSSFDQTAIVTANETSYEDNPLSDSTTYSYRVRAFNSTDHSAYTNIATVTTGRGNVPPGETPMQLTATAISADKIKLKWTAAKKTDADVAGYNIYQNGVRISSARGTTFTVSDLDPITPYCFTVAAFDKRGDEMVETAQVCVTTKPNS